ncbi:MAG: zeta toxin family protein [Candidatus Spyradenecus sp.]
MKPRLLVIAGPNGSGKTSITEQLHDLKHRWMLGCHYINPDQIAKTQFGDWNNDVAVLQAAQLAERQRYACLEKGDDFAFETVFSTQDKLDFLRKAKARGYFIRFFFVGTESPMINIERVALRVLKGGHTVAIPKIIERYSRSMINAAEAATFVDRAYFYDNSITLSEGAIPTWTPLFRTVEGALCPKYSCPTQLWAKQIYQALSPA